jgi:hypothetical protein
MTTTSFYKEVLDHARKENDWATLRHLFKNYRNGKGLNLTKLGLTTLIEMGFDHEAFKVTSDLTFTAKLRILLDRYNKYPYYLDRNKLVMFGTEDRIMFKLYGKDLAAWVEHMENNL